MLRELLKQTLKTTRYAKYIDRSERLSENDILHCFPFVRTGRPDQSSCKRLPLLITTIQADQSILKMVRSAVVGFAENFGKKANILHSK